MMIWSLWWQTHRDILMIFWNIYHISHHYQTAHPYPPISILFLLDIIIYRTFSRQLANCWSFDDHRIQIIIHPCSNYRYPFEILIYHLIKYHIIILCVVTYHCVLLRVRLIIMHVNALLRINDYHCNLLRIVLIIVMHYYGLLYVRSIT